MKNDEYTSAYEQVLLTEYTALRTEATSLMTGENALIATTFSFIAALFGLNFLFGKANLDAVKFMIIGICPLAAMFFGILWINTFYRRVRIGAYLFLLERDIDCKIKDDQRKIYWEHWILHQTLSRSAITRVGRFYGYIIFGCWLFSPFLVLCCAHFLFPNWELLAPSWSLVSFFTDHPYFGVFFLIVLLTYIYVMYGLCKEILKLKDINNLRSQKRVGTFLQRKKKLKKRHCQSYRLNRKK